jgi:hypothetical protein
MRTWLTMRLRRCRGWQAMADEPRMANYGGRQRRWIFPCCAMMLVVVAVGIDPVLSSLKQYYRKTPIGLRVPLAEFNVEALPSFKLPPTDSPFEIPISNEEVGGDDMLSLRVQERGAFGMDGQAYLVVSYYSDPEYRIRHTPEICYRMLGATIRSIATSELTFKDRSGHSTRVKVRTVMADEKGATAVIAYIFSANARFFTSRNEIRLVKGIPGDKRWFVSKIEVVARAEHDQDPGLALERCLKLLAESLPELVDRHLPSRKDVTRHEKGAPNAGV